MDPFLEDAAVWPDFHRRFVACLHEALERKLSERYLAGRARRGTIDWLEIRMRDNGALVTTLDILDLADRTTDRGRESYLCRRHQVKESNASLVDIDLLLQGQSPLPYSREGLPLWQYSVTVARSTSPERYEIYTSSLDKRLPRFRVPLDSPARDEVLDLQYAFARCYEEGQYSQRIDYARDPPVPMSDTDWDTMDGILVAANLRPPLPAHNDIAVAAHAIWEEEGRPHGHDKTHWRRAIEELRRKS